MAKTQNTHTEVGHPEKGKESSVFPPFDTTSFSTQLVWLAICFIGLYIFLSRVVIPRIAATIEQRSDRISRDLDEAQRLKNESEKALANYEQALAEARAKAQKIVQETREELQAEVDAEKTEVERQIDAKLKDADERIAQSKQAALQHVNEVASDITEALIDKLVGLRVTDQDISDAINDPLKKAS